MTGKKETGLVILLIFVMITANNIGSINAEILSGEYLTYDVPSDYKENIEEQIPYLDDCYLALSELFGCVPYDGEKIEIKYDPTIGPSYAGNPIRIAKGHWDGLYAVGPHELAHDFSFAVSGWPHVFTEGIANLGLTYCLKNVAPNYGIPISTSLDGEPRYLKEWDDGTSVLFFTYEYMKKFAFSTLDDYISSGANLQNISDTLYFNSYATTGMLIKIGEKYGWDSFSKYFKLVEDVKIGPKGSNQPEFFVNLLSLSVGDDLTPLFKEWGFPVAESNKDPVPIISSEHTKPEVNTTVIFDATNSYDPDGQILNYFFDFGDGKTRGWTTSSIAYHKYTTVGEFNASLMVMDELGSISFHEAQINLEIVEKTDPFPLFIYSIFSVLIVIGIIYFIRTARAKKTSKDEKIC